MDHIPHPFNSLVPHLAVPILGSIPSDINSFDDYPVLAGFAVPNSAGEGFVFRDNLDTEDWASLIQSWLYFGVLRKFAACVGLSLDISCLTVLGADGVRNITTSNFISNLEGRIQSNIHRNRLRIENYNDEIVKVLTSAKKWTAWFSGQSFAATEPIPLVCLSVGILLNSLDLINLHIRNDPFSFDLKHHPTVFLVNHMISRGWCPHEARNICSNIPPCAAYFLSLLRRRARPGIGHQFCSEKKCTAHNVNQATYAARHVEDSCQCPIIGVDEEKLVRIIKQGGIPIVTVKTEKKDSWSLELAASASCNLFGLLTEFRTGRILVVPAIWRGLQIISHLLSLQMRKLSYSRKPRVQRSMLQKNLFHQIEEHVDKALYSDVKSTPSIDASYANHAEMFPYYRTLVKTWNFLCRRNTTKRDDLYLILANLLDYNSYQVSKLSPETERLKAILWNCQALPLSVLFHQAPRCNPFGNHKDRWVPLSIEGEWLDEHSILRTDAASLTYHEDGIKPFKRAHPILILPPTKLMNTSALVLDAEPSFDILAPSSPSDQLDVDDGRFQATALILADDLPLGTGTVSGACIQVLRILEATEDKGTRLIGIYDCPVTIQARGPGSSLSAQPKIVQARSCLREYILELECEPMAVSQILKRRTYTIQLFQHPLHQILVSGAWVFVSVSCYALFLSGASVYVSPTTGFQTDMLDVHLQLHAKHWAWKTFLYFVYSLFCVLSLFIIGLPVLEVFNGFAIPWQGISRWDASPITKAFFLLNYSKYVLIIATLVWDYKWCDVAYDTWVASFDDTWAQGKSVMTWKGIFHYLAEKRKEACKLVLPKRRDQT